MWHRIGRQGGKYWGKSGAGIVFTNGHNVLLLQRSEKGDNGGKWGIPGGKAGDEETLLGTAQRETREEIGHLPKKCKRIGHFDAQDGHHRFRTYICSVPKCFECKLSDEHDDYEWFDIDTLKYIDLHKKLKPVVEQIVDLIKKKMHHYNSEMSGFAETCDFAEFMGSTGAVYTGEKEGPDWQHQGAPWSMNPQRREKKKKKKKRSK